jgi:hypothetical protein
VKQINLPSHLFVQKSTGLAPHDITAAAAQTNDAHENRKRVILCGLFVEREIEAIIGYYLYPGTAVSEQQAFVAGEILGSDALTFNHKKRLVMSLVNKKKWLEGEAKNDFEGGLKRVISFRNAFTHGNIIVRDSIPVLEYFEGGQKKCDLTDEYWTRVENDFNAVVEQIEAIKLAAGMPRPQGLEGPSQ